MNERELNLIGKRAIDLIGSLLGLVVLSPLLIVVAIWIKLDSKGPVFFYQERLGKNGETFNIIKFRTMVENAENIGSGLFTKSQDDPRITKSGSFLRKTSVDELPQLLNVLLGEMSLVGPRPPVTYFPYKGYISYPPWEKIRFTMRPGITGLAQVEVRKAKDWDERIKLDIEYVNNFNILLDFKILFHTVQKITHSEDVYVD